jgi:hypothetical protein
MLVFFVMALFLSQVFERQRFKKRRWTLLFKLPISAPSPIANLISGAPFVSRAKQETLRNGKPEDVRKRRIADLKPRRVERVADRSALHVPALHGFAYRRDQRVRRDSRAHRPPALRATSIDTHPAIVAAAIA